MSVTPTSAAGIGVPGGPLRVLVIGGTGRTGGRVATEALAAGHVPVVFGRSATPANVPVGAEAFAGDARDPAALAAALVGVHAVVVSLSIPRAGPSPFARVTGPPDLHSANARALVAAMASTGVRRVVKVSAQGVGPAAPRAGWGFRALVAVSNLRPAFADHAVADAIIAGSDLAFTVVHPPVLSDDPASGRVHAGEDVTTGTWTRLPRADLARWIVGALGDPAWVGRAVTLAPLP